MKHTFFAGFAVFSCLLISTVTFSQSLVIDSLKQVIDRQSRDSEVRFLAQLHLARLRGMTGENEQAIHEVKDLVTASRAQRDGKYGAYAYGTLTYLLAKEDSLTSATVAMDSSLWYAAATTDKKAKGYVMLRKGWFNTLLGDTELAYENLLEALSLLEGQGEYSYESNIYHHLAGISSKLQEPEKQLYYSKKSLSSALRGIDADAISNGYLSMGSAYLSRFRLHRDDQAQLDSSFYYYRKLLQFTQTHGDRITLQNTEGLGALNLANLYFEFYPKTYRDSAENYLNQALAVGRKLGYPEIIGNAYGILSEYEMQAGNFAKAEKLLLAAMSEVSMQSRDNVLIKSRLSNALARVAEQNSNPAAALGYYKDYLNYYREVYNQEKSKTVSQQDARYNTKRTAIELESARLEALATKRLNQFYIALILLILVLSLFLYRSYRSKVNDSAQKQALLEREKNKAQLEAAIESEKNIGLQAERELMQERLDRLERELLAGTLQAEEKTRLVVSLKEKVNRLHEKDPLIRQIERVVAKTEQIDSEYRHIRSDIADIRPEFVSGLQEKANYSLTRLDLKYCSYIQMGLSTKEIASRLSVDPKSIRMAKYRIKQKLNLPKDQTLDQFISELGASVNKLSQDQESSRNAS